MCIFLSDENITVDNENESMNSLTWLITLFVLLINIIIIFAAIFVCLIKRKKNLQNHIGLELKETRSKQNYYTDIPHHSDTEQTVRYGYENMM